MPIIDLNADIGEGFGPYSCGDDEAMLALVTSASVACGFHAGDPEIMARTFRSAKQHGVAVGAHPGFPDLAGFGRRRIPYSNREIENLIAYQIGAAQGMAAAAGHRVTHVKLHGALGNIAETDVGVAAAAGQAIRSVDVTLVVLAIAGSEQIRAAEACGLKVAAEIFADRGYTESGHLLPRGQPGALITDPYEASRRTLAMLGEGAIITSAGTRIATKIDSVCVHGDTPAASAMAAHLRRALEKAGLEISPFSGR